MIKKVTITNYLGESMTYDIDGVQIDNPSGLIITSIEGLGPVKATINMVDLATTDGRLYNSARLTGRNIVIKALFTHATMIEEARYLSYKYFPIRSKVKFEIVTDNRTAETDGYVESNEPDIFSENSSCQISILCESPFFNGGKNVYESDRFAKLFKFPFGNESLTTRLIKLSEETDTMKINYDGDIETGMEIEVSAPTDDIFESISITNVELTNDKNEKIKIDTSKMSSQVPNTYPLATSLKACSYVMSETEGKFLTILPGDFSLSSSKPYYSVLNMYTKELHSFNSELNHMVIDLTTNTINRLDDIKHYYSDVFACIKGSIYTIRLSNADLKRSGIYRFNEGTNDWDFITGMNYSTNSNWIVKAVSYQNKIHFFISNKTTGGSVWSNLHYTFDGDSYTSVENLSRDYSDLFPSSDYNFEGARIIVHKDKIHIFGGTNYEKVHYTWNGITWQKETDTFPPYYGAGLSVVSYDSRLHMFRPKRTSSEVGGTHYILNESTNTWEEATVFLPYSYSGQPLQNIYLNCIYFISNELSGSYSAETANNDRLIDGDRLVINTNKGKKSVYLYRGDNKYNIINALERGSTWFQLHRGINTLTYTAESGSEDMKIIVTTDKLYEGV